MVVYFKLCVLGMFSCVAAFVFMAHSVAFESPDESVVDGKWLIQSAADEARNFETACSSLLLSAQVAERSLTQAEINKELAVHLQAIDQAIEASSAYPEMVKRLQDARASDAPRIVEQIKANQNLLILYDLLTFGLHYGGDNLVECRVKRGSESQFSVHSFF